MIRLPFILILIALIAATVAQNLTTYEPECAQPCIEESINSTGICAGPEDSTCLCNNMQRIGPGSFACAQKACPANTTQELIGELRGAYMKYCSDVGATPSGGWNNYNGGAATTSASQGTAAATSTMATSSTASPAATTGANTSPSSSPDAGGGGSNLSAGAIAGIAVGGVVATICVTGGLLLFAFRLGKGQSRRNQQDPSAPGQQEEGIGGSGNEDPNTAVGGVEKAQLEGTPISELQTEHTLSGFGHVKELPAYERPAELSADPISPRNMGDSSPTLPYAPWRS
ncbi:hypothetical protein F4677DRAFT_412628 [Hypoxylon crocopeplum]|nr:hypothetical protein F4677DRAFT_412628 [Hypoxylon crocopeplum]